jgi:ParB family chromosome partitioning protein
MGHARALLSLDAANQILLANEIIARRLSVREAEKLVARALREAEEGARPARKVPALSGDAKRLEEAMSDFLGTRVSLKMGAKEKGQLLIDFHGWEHLNSLLERQGMSGLRES